MHSIVVADDDSSKPASQMHTRLNAMNRFQIAGAADRRQRFLSALFYGICSFLIVSINKVVLTNWHFPSFQFLALCQLISTIFILLVLRTLNYVHFPLRIFQVSRQIMPLPLLHAGNLLFGLGGTQRVSLPMFIALRRFSIFLTMICEMFLFNEWPTPVIYMSVLLMVGGAAIAACNDMTFDVGGYTLVLCSAGFTAISNVYTKQALREQLTGVGGKYSILFYNALLVLPATAILAYSNGEFERVYAFPHVWNLGFMLCFSLSCVMALVLNYSTILCLNYNSALTTTVVGCLKNILTTYAGMIFLGGDYIFSALNFIGINVSVVGSLIYSVIVYKRSSNVIAPDSSRLEAAKHEPTQYKPIPSAWEEVKNNLTGNTHVQRKNSKNDTSLLISSNTNLTGYDVDDQSVDKKARDHVHKV